MIYNLLLCLVFFGNYFMPNTFVVEKFNQTTNDLLKNYRGAEIFSETVSSNQIPWEIHINPHPEKINIEEYVPLAKSALVEDLNSGVYILEKNANTQLQIASLTKLMTAYVILKETPQEQIFTVPALSTQPGDSLTGLLVNERLTAEALLKGLLITSGSDSALTLAIGSAGNEENFVNKMNTSAQELKLTNSNFTNPVGWDNQNNYSSAKDMAVLSRVLLGNQLFRKIVSTKYDSIQTQDGRNILLSNTNILLGSDGYVGLKTGYTFGAGECLVALNNTNGHEVVSVILGSPDRFGQTSSLLSWINGNFLW